MTRVHRPKAGFWMRLWVIVLYPLDSLLFEIRWHHLERIPATGGVLIAANHISQADTAAMARLVWQAGRLPRFLIKSTVFSWPIVGRAMAGSGQIPVYRAVDRTGESDDAADSVREAIAALRGGEAVIIYPEGTITDDPDYLPMRGKTGVARIALAVPDIPVLPVGQWGAHLTLGRRGRFRPFPRKPHEASVGRPVDLSAYHGQPATAQSLREATDAIMAAIGEEVATLRGRVPNWI